MDSSAARGSKLQSVGQMSRFLSTLGDYFQTTLIFKLLPIGSPVIGWDFTAFGLEGRIASLQDPLDAETAGCGLIVPQWG